MTEVLNPPKSSVPTQNITVADRSENNKPRLQPTSIAIPVGAQASRSGHLNLDVFSPVNQNGSFEFDRVIKSGQVYKRSRKTRQWKSFFLVLRPNLLSMYKNASEEKLLKQINLSDLTAAAYLKDPKGRRQHVFGLYTPSHNYQFQATTDADARTWVELIRTEARIDEEEESMIFGSPPAGRKDFSSQKGAFNISDSSPHRQDHDRLASSSPEPLETPLPPPIAREGVRVPGARQSSMHELDYSGQEHGSYSDFSDTALYGASTLSIPQAGPMAISANSNTSTNPATRSSPPRNASQISNSNNDAVAKNNSISATAGNTGPELDEARVIWQGYLLCLKSKGGVRQWKRLWVVLRPKTLAFYKNEEEYSAHLLIPFSSILSAIEIDPISRSKSHCMQIIAEDRNYRFCAPSEEGLARCLGALKSQLAKRKGREKKKVTP